jgi:outer membrane lipoprotein-sorting protein
MRARFVQTADDGTTAEGNLFLARPGKIRFEYDAPSPILLVSDGIMLTFYDANLQQVSNIPIGSTPAEIITAKHVKLNNDKFKITRFEKKDDETSVTFVKTEAPDDSSITLYFSEKPLELARWAVRDAQQNQTKITLKDVTKDLKLESKIFYFDDPRPKEER